MQVGDSATPDDDADPDDEPGEAYSYGPEFTVERCGSRVGLQLHDDELLAPCFVPNDSLDKKVASEVSK